jgi:hypothetical protein
MPRDVHQADVPLVKCVRRLSGMSRNSLIPSRRITRGPDHGIRRTIVQRLVAVVIGDALLWEPGFMA